MPMIRASSIFCSQAQLCCLNRWKCCVGAESCASKEPRISWGGSNPFAATRGDKSVMRCLMSSYWVVGGGLLDAVLWHPARRPRCLFIIEASHDSQVDISQAEVPHQLWGHLRRPWTQEGLPSAQPHCKCSDRVISEEEQPYCIR